MQKISDIIERQTGLKFRVSEPVVLRNGRKAERANIKVGNQEISFLLVEVAEFFKVSDIRDLIQLAELERVIIHTSHLFPEHTQELKEKRIGHIDDHGHYYIPLEVGSTQAYMADEGKEASRSSSTSNEFLLGFLLLKGHGQLDRPQAEIGKLINKSAATVNIVLKRMEKEKLIVRTESGYHLANFENYFDRWCFILSQYKVSKEIARFTSKISDDELRKFLFKNGEERNCALSGPRIESLLKDGYLVHVEEFSIFVDTKSQTALMKELKLIPSAIGEIALYPSILSLSERGNLVHEVVLCGELVNSNNPRIKEAGEKRFEKYLKVAKKVIHERFSGKHF